MFAAGTLYVRLSDLADLNRRQDELEREISSLTVSSLPALNKSFRDLQARQPLTGTASLPVPAQQQTVTERIPLSRKVSAGASSWVSPVGRQSRILSLSSRIENGSGRAPSTLVLVLTTSADAQDRVIPLQWLVVE